jgi:hypothetical protein
MMNTMSHYRPSKRPSVKDVSQWYIIFEDTMEFDWKGPIHKHVMVEQAYPFPDFYRVTYTIDGVKKSKLFYGESAWMNGERFVSDLGFSNVHGSF